MKFSDLHHYGNVTFLVLLLVTIHLTSCHGNNVGYKHLRLDGDEILVDQIVPLEEEDSEVDELIENLNDVKKDKLTHDLHDVIDNLRKELWEMQKTHAEDREALLNMEKKMESYHRETIISNAEVVQIRQLVSENFHNIRTLNEKTHDHSVYLESVEIFQKETNRDLRRFRDYKEKAAKRFHQLENQIEKQQKNNQELSVKFNNITQEITGLTNGQKQLRNITSVINDTLHTAINLTPSCCVSTIQSRDSQSANQNEISESHDRKLTNKHRGYSDSKSNSGKVKSKSKQSNEVEIIEFGSGESKDDYLSHNEERTNTLNKEDLANKPTPGRVSENVLEGSGETVFNNEEGSGELGSGAIETDELIPLVDLSRFVELTEFRKENVGRDETIQVLREQNQNLTTKMFTLEERLASIQLGSFMQSLQDSLMNFTQNVITLDQWKVSSTQMVNSTLNNQDQIFKLTSMILDNADKLKDLKWQISNTEIAGDQQFRILRMHIVRLNNTVEDIKEQLAHYRDSNNNKRPGYQSTYYGYQRLHYPSSQSTSDNNGGTQSTDGNGGRQSTDQPSLDSLLSKLDELGLQIIYNQNRLGNLEVKVLNETLYQCRKQHTDSHQDTRISKLEVMLESTTNSLGVTHRFVRDVDKVLKDLDDSVRTAQRRARTNTANIGTLRQLIPIMMSLKSEVQNFMFYLPSDCQEYYERGYRESGVYVIHPIRAIKSSHVTCYFDQSGGWTVLQQRFNGGQEFNQKWAMYREGFGNASSEYWIGNDIIYLITSNKNYSLRIDMTDIEGNQWQANYKHFHVSLPSEKSALSVSGFHGNISDSFSYSDSMGFSTADNDNDASSTNCGYFYEAGWWYKHCQTCNLNGRYTIGFLWFNMDTNRWIQLVSSSMKILPT